MPLHMIVTSQIKNNLKLQLWFKRFRNYEWFSANRWILLSDKFFCGGLQRFCKARIVKQIMCFLVNLSRVSLSPRKDK